MAPIQTHSIVSRRILEPPKRADSEVFVSANQPELETLEAPRPDQAFLKALAAEVQLDLQTPPSSCALDPKIAAALKLLAHNGWKPTEDLLISSSESAFKGRWSDLRIIQALSEFGSPRALAQLGRIAAGDFYRTEILAFLNDSYKGEPFSKKLTAILAAPFELAGSILGEMPGESSRGAVGALTIALAVLVVGEPIVCVLAGGWALKRAIFNNPKRRVLNGAMQEFARATLQKRTQGPEEVDSVGPSRG